MTDASLISYPMFDESSAGPLSLLQVPSRVEGRKCIVDAGLMQKDIGRVFPTVGHDTHRPLIGEIEHAAGQASRVMSLVNVTP